MLYKWLIYLFRIFIFFVVSKFVFKFFIIFILFVIFIILSVFIFFIICVVFCNLLEEVMFDVFWYWISMVRFMESDLVWCMRIGDWMMLRKIRRFRKIECVIVFKVWLWVSFFVLKWILNLCCWYNWI